jgi:hypothetical protein
VILYPFRFLCVEEDLQILPDETAEHRLMRGRLAGIITRIERRWAGVRGIKPVGPEYVYLGDRPAEGMHVYRNRRHLLFWVEGNEFPFDFLAACGSVTATGRLNARSVIMAVYEGKRVAVSIW